MESRKIALIFDMDGVLVNSEHVIFQAAIKGLNEYGVFPTESDFIPYIGTGEDSFIGNVARKHGLEYRLEMKKRVYDIYLELVDGLIEIYPGTLPVLLSLQQLGIPTALASSADCVKVEANLRAASISPSFFNVILSGDDVKYKKPEPDIFLMAAQRMDMPPNRCIVLEDAVNGIKAAKTAGMKALGVLTSFPPEELLAAGADAVCATIGDIWDALPSVASFSEDKS